MFNVNYNPDVLTCLANLSNDEVFTPPDVANKMLDLLPEKFWSDKTITFLDPCTKSGVFLREITKRLLIGLENEIPNLQERIDHILTKQVFGIGITELTALLTRRSLYCSKNANQEFSITKAFDNNDGNIFYKNIEHSWKNLKCEYCGASKDLFNRKFFLEQHAYNFIHTDNPKELFNMKFDVIIGNPPYQIAEGGGGSTDSAMPLYNKFIENSIKLNPRFLSMIIPSRWMIGGRGLDSFRKKMIEDKRIKAIYDFENEKECFSGVNIDGGISYFLWEKNYNGECKYTFKPSKGEAVEVKRSLANNHSKFILRDVRYLSLIEKVSKKGTSFSEIVSSTMPYGIRKFLFNDPKRYPKSNLNYNKFENSLRIHGVKGLKGGAKRMVGFINQETVTRNIESINKHKLFFTTSYSTNAINPPEIITGKPGDICTETFLEIGPFDSKKERDNCLSYMKTNFFKTLLFIGKGSMQVTKSVFSYVPLIKFNSEISDDFLYKKFNLNDKDIKLIENLFNEK